MKFLIALIFSFSAFAHEDCVNCAARTNSQVLPLEEFSNSLEHWSANNDQVMKAPCKNFSFNNEEMHSRLSSYTGRKNKRVGGVRFANENPELLRVFSDLVQKRSTNPLVRLFGGGSGRVDFQRQYGINPECDKVLCAVDKIWGQYVGRKLLYMNLIYGFNGSEFVSRNAGRFTEPELDDVMVGLSDLPRAIMPMYRNKTLMKSLVPSPNSTPGFTVWANSLITLFEPWFKGSQGLRHQAFIHEIGHNMRFDLPPEKNRQWQAMSSWVKLGDKWQYDTIGACMPSKYAMTSPEEDFAETAAAYRYNARALKHHCPAKYNFIRDNAFRGVEYLEESQCSGK